MTESKLLHLNSVTDVAAVAGYVVLIVVAIIVTWTSLAAVVEQHESLSAAESMLAQLEGRSLFSGKNIGPIMSDAPAGSAFLEGRDLNVAGAALLQRVASAVRDVGGSVLSSQVDLDAARAKDGWVGLVVSCEIQEASLQKLVYDVEAGMPFLYIDNLTVEGAKAGVAGDRMRILMGVSGRWWHDK
jgi:general secretion pathway protein M